MSPTIAKKPMRLNPLAELVPTERYADWHEIASATPGLTEIDQRTVDGLAGHFRQSQERGYAGKLSIERIALDLETAPRMVRDAIRHLIELGLLGVKPGAGQRSSEFLPALPKRIAASLATVVGDDDVPPL